jgi:hypothetical protein
MNKIIFLFLGLLFSAQSFSITPYKGNYDLYAQTAMGNLKIGTAILNLEIKNNQFEFTTDAKTESLWKTIYDYSRSEKSIGNEIDGKIINTYFSVTEKIKNEVKKNYEIFIVAGKNYAVTSNGEEFKIKPGVLVDSLSVYLALSNDMIDNPNQSEFTYQVVGESNVRELIFKIDGDENILINENEVETIRVICDELRLTINLSPKDNFQPIRIHKINGKTAFTMILIDFET